MKYKIYNFLIYTGIIFLVLFGFIGITKIHATEGFMSLMYPIFDSSPSSTANFITDGSPNFGIVGYPESYCTPITVENGIGPFNFNTSSVYFDTLVFPSNFKRIYGIGIATGTIEIDLKTGVTSNNISDTGTVVASTTRDINILLDTLSTSSQEIFWFTNPYYITNTSTQYWLRIYVKNGSAYGAFQYYVPQSTSTSGTYRSEYRSTATNCGWNTTYDAKAQLYGSIPSGNAYIIGPTNNRTSKDFNQWVVSFHNTLYSSSSYFYIDYGNDPNNLIYRDTSASNFTQNVNTSLLYMEGYLSKSRKLSNGTWYAKLTYISNNSNAIYTSQITTFSINSTSTHEMEETIDTSNLNFESPYYISASSTDEMCDWTHVSGCFVNAGKAISSFLFTPTKAIQTRVLNLALDFQSVFPFSVYMTVMNNLQQNASTTLSTQTLNLPLLISSGTIPILESTTLSSIVGETNANNFKSTFSNFLYLGTMIIMVISLI